MKPRSASDARGTRRGGCGVLLLALLAAGCAGPSAQDRAMAHMFWVAPSSLTARTALPHGLGIAEAPKLVMSLVETPGGTPRTTSFTLVSSGADTWRLKPGDYRRFSNMQQRVVASIGSQASVAAGLQVAYCAVPDTTAGGGKPVAEVYDRASGTQIMSAPAQGSARALYPTLPPCS